MTDTSDEERLGAVRPQSAEQDDALPRPAMVTIAAARLARAWRVVQKEAACGSTSDARLVEMHNAVMRLRSVTGTTSLWSAVDALGSRPSDAAKEPAAARPR